jgi:hypothetical protein
MRCCLRLSLRPNFFRHRGHSKGFSLVWVLLWRFKCSGRLNVLKQTSHNSDSSCFFSLCILNSCVSNVQKVIRFFISQPKHLPYAVGHVKRHSIAINFEVLYLNFCTLPVLKKMGHATFFDCQSRASQDP